MSAKSVANRIKEAGLKRLRWYCQMCEKQCRDDNGFKQHCTTEAHLRKMEEFASHSGSYTEKFSRQFEAAFMDALISGHNTKRVFANLVYNEMIRDKQHIHMNATRWSSLNSFVQYLASNGRVEVEETERGPYITYIDPEAKVRNEEQKLKDQAKERAAERRQKQLEDQQIAAHALRVAEEERRAAEEEDNNDLQVGELRGSLVSLPAPKKLHVEAAPSIFKAAESVKVEPEKPAAVPAPRAPVHEVTVSEPIPTSGWIAPNLVVQINSSKVGNGKLKGEKGVVVSVGSNGKAEILLLKSAESVFDVEEKRLDSILPAVGGVVRILGGPYKGRDGLLESFQADTATCSVRVDGHSVPGFRAEHVCKVFDA